MLNRRIGDMWEHLSIRVKLLAAFFCVLSLVSVFNLYLNNNNFAITDQFNHTVMNYYTINRMKLLVENNYYAVDSFLKTLEPEQKIQYQTTKEEIQNMIEPLYEEFDSEVYCWIYSIAFEFKLKRGNEIIQSGGQRSGSHASTLYYNNRGNVYICDADRTLANEKAGQSN